MKVIFSLLIISAIVFQVAITSGNTVLDTYLIGKASDKKFSCLMSALGKINDDSQVGKDNDDWTSSLQEGVQQGIDVNTLLIQYQYFNQVDRESIKSCELTLNRATERCKSVYKDCENVTYNNASFSTDPLTEAEVLPFVTRRCPENYIRYGCCTCMRSCETYPELFDLEVSDIHGYCQKRPATVSKLSDKQESDEYEPSRDKFVERCKDGWTRVGIRLCVPKCPLGWFDHGDRCVKAGKINLMPFSWQPGDEE